MQRIIVLNPKGGSGKTTIASNLAACYAKIRRSANRIGITANRVRGTTLASQSLLRFIGSLDIPLITTPRDTQSYARSAALGVGVPEMPRRQVQQDLARWRQITDWLNGRRRSQSQSTNATATNIASIERSAPSSATVSAAPFAGVAVGDRS